MQHERRHNAGLMYLRPSADVKELFINIDEVVDYAGFFGYIGRLFLQGVFEKVEVVFNVVIEINFAVLQMLHKGFPLEGLVINGSVFEPEDKPKGRNFIVRGFRFHVVS